MTLPTIGFIGLGIMGKPMAARIAQIRNDFVVIREYAHKVREGRIEGDRIDFAETLYWNAGVKTDEKTGQMTVRGKAIIDHTPMGRFGEAEELIGTTLWLLSDAGKFVTGIVVPVDGGFSAIAKTNAPLTEVSACSK